jgi:FMN phosphatase YigB (HAD superfamily)
LGTGCANTARKLGARYGTEQLAGTLRRTVLAEQPEIGHDVTRFRLAVLERAFSDAGYPPAEGRRLAAEAFAVFIEARHQVRLYEGVRETLEALRANYQLGTLTNGNADIARLGLTDLFEFLVQRRLMSAPASRRRRSFRRRWPTPAPTPGA